MLNKGVFLYPEVDPGLSFTKYEAEISPCLAAPDSS